MVDENQNAPRGRIQSVDHALRLLLLFQERPLLRVTTVAEELGIAPSTAHRLMTTLVHRGFVTQNRVSKAYRLGPSVIELVLQRTRSTELRDVSEPHLRSLAALLGETVNLLVLEGDSVLFVAGVESDQQTRTHVLTGTLLPAYATSGGKLMLAEMSRDSLREIYPSGLLKLTPHTLTFTELLDELALVTMRGYAINEQESQLGLSAIAVPLRDRSGRTCAAVALSMPSSRMSPELTREVITRLRECATRIRADLFRSH